VPPAACASPPRDPPANQSLQPFTLCSPFPSSAFLSWYDVTPEGRICKENVEGVGVQNLKGSTHNPLPGRAAALVVMPRMAVHSYGLEENTVMYCQVDVSKALPVVANFLGVQQKVVAYTAGIT